MIGVSPVPPLPLSHSVGPLIAQTSIHVGGKAMFTEHKYLGTQEYDAACERLKALARQRGKPIGYSPIFTIMKLSPGNHAAKEAGRMLGEISEQMHLAGKPMLSALVINQQQGTPGGGFFDLAVQLGKLPAGASDQEKIAFWKKELAAVYATKW
jgi:hypothetical protein